MRFRCLLVRVSGNVKKRGHAVAGISFSFRFINFCQLVADIDIVCGRYMVHAVADMVCGRYRRFPYRMGDSACSVTARAEGGWLKVKVGPTSKYSVYLTFDTTLFLINHHRRSSLVWHVFARDLAGTGAGTFPKVVRLRPESRPKGPRRVWGFGEGQTAPSHQLGGLLGERFKVCVIRRLFNSILNQRRIAQCLPHAE